MKNKPRKVFERVYIHAATVQTKEGWVLVLHSMDAFSEYAFETIFNRTPKITIEALNQLFDNVLKDYKPMFHPKKIMFVTNLSQEYENLFKQTQAAQHRFVFNKEVTAKAMKGLLGSMSYDMKEL
jgi:hypothetical protein